LNKLEAKPDTYWNVSNVTHPVQIVSKYVVENDIKCNADTYNPWELAFDVETFTRESSCELPTIQNGV